MDRSTRQPSKEETSNLPRGHERPQHRPLLHLRKNRPSRQKLLVEQPKLVDEYWRTPHSLPKLLRIPITFNSRETHALLDTRSAASFISTSLFSTLSENEVSALPIDIANFVNASGGKIEIQGKFELPVILRKGHILLHP